MKIAKKRVGKIIFEVPAILERIMISCEGPDQLIKAGDKIPDFDYYIPLLSLPRVLNIGLNDVHTDIPYLFVDDEKIAELDFISNYQEKFKVGFVWAGNREHANDLNRSCDITYFFRLTHLPGIQLFSFQKNPSESDYEKLRRNGKIVDLNKYINDFYDTAVFIKNMDLIISVDTAVAHLAGALGKKIWLILPYNSDWRWLLNRDDSPWYPTMKIFRQKKLGDWGYVFDKVSTELKSMTE